MGKRAQGVPHFRRHPSVSLASVKERHFAANPVCQRVLIEEFMPQKVAESHMVERNLQ